MRRRQHRVGRRLLQSTCQTEAGFTCQNVLRRPDTVDLHAEGQHAANAWSCPVKYRDFKNESVTGGHPDFFFLGATVSPALSITGVQGQTGATSFSKRYCVPNSSGPARQNDSTARCLGHRSGEPRLRPASRRSTLHAPAATASPRWPTASSPTAATTRNGGHVPGYTPGRQRPDQRPHVHLGGVGGTRCTTAARRS